MSSSLPRFNRPPLELEQIVYNLGLNADNIFNPKKDGAVGNGVTLNTQPMQKSLDGAALNNGIVYLPKGDWLTGTLDWSGQTIIGAGYDCTRIRGLPGQDVFHGSASIINSQGSRITDLEILVDDSVDASASFPQRGGVGNAAFAFDFADGAAGYTSRFSQMSMERVFVESLSGASGGQNNSAGFYLQAGVNLCRFRDVQFYRLKYGWWDHYPTSNLTSIEFANDHNHFDSLYFNGCGNACRFVNHGHGNVTNLVIHGSGTNGFHGVGVVSQARNTLYNMSFDQVMIEDLSGDAWLLPGEGHTVEAMSISGASTNTITFDASYSSYKALGLSCETTNPVAIVNGSYNSFLDVRRGDSPATTPIITDNGVGNMIHKSRALPVLMGAGSPEGVRTAPVGTLFLRSDGGAATCLYVKESGAGNTGWVAK